MFQVVGPTDDFVHLFFRQPVHEASAVVGVDQIDEHLVHAHDLGRLTGVGHVVQHVLEHVTVAGIQGLLQKLVSFRNHGVGHLRKHLGPITANQLIERAVANEPCIREIHTIPVVVPVPHVLPHGLVFNFGWGIRHLRLIEHGEVLAEQKIARVVGQVMLVLVHLVGQGLNALTCLSDVLGRGGAVLNTASKGARSFLLSWMNFM